MTDFTALLPQAAQTAFDSIVDREGLTIVPANVGYSFLGHSRASIEKMYELKGRRFDNPCIAAGSGKTFDSVMRPMPGALRAWIGELAGWTPVAVVWRLDPDAPAVRRLDPWVLSRCRIEETMAVFLNTGPFVEHMVALAEERGTLLVGSSANLSGEGNSYAYQDIPESLRKSADFSVDAGPATYTNDQGRATTIVNLTNFTVRRKGVMAEEILADYERMAASRPELPPALSVVAK